MKIGLIDVDGHNFPNIPLMKISAWHKAQGDSVEWYDPMFSDDMDIVYLSKVFSFTPDYMYPIRAKEIKKGGSGYCIELVDGKEVYDKSKDINLSYEVEHIYPDYSIYQREEVVYDEETGERFTRIVGSTVDTAYGFLTRGCPRGCEFCHVEAKEGRRTYKVADLDEFWRGQKNIVLCDPNILACKQHPELLQQLIDSKAYVDFNQGLDIRLTNERNIALINKIKVKQIHFAWDNPKDDLTKYFERYKALAKHKPHGRYGMVYVLVNFGSTLEEDLHRIYTLRDMGYDPYVMIYNKDDLPKRHELRRLQRWVNNKVIFRSCNTFEEYQKGATK